MAPTRGDIDLTGAVAVVAGARGGIGTAMVATLRDAGAIVVEADLPDVDVSDPASLRTLLDDVSHRHGRIDVLVHAAGMVSNENFADRTTDDVDAELAVNLASPMHLVRLALPLLRNGRLDESRARARVKSRARAKMRARPRAKRVRSHVIVLGSLGGVMPMPDQAVYAAGKFGLRGAMLSLGMSLRDERIAVTTVLPSSVDTPMLWREVAEDGNALQFLGPPQSPEDIAARVIDVIGRHVPEVFPNRVDGWLARVAMLAPGLLPHVLPRLEPLGRRGMAKYRGELERRGDLPTAG
ncbi:SDR family oxidoreductase [uncultured Corynebacterium sp.]|uniref:SDR family NAD(P)-dependent oxidoreductase n=1 Tax=uncultured Corynebacterium sp. TaxID=159447 RepID=UPI0025F2662C|nr:SDR family NAD(P)-dependent oxidoreductase [uncultured Corynebacterium sp.]